MFFISVKSETKLTLYQLIFAERIVENAMAQYCGLQGCAPRLEYPLTASPLNPNPQASQTSVMVKCCIVKHIRKRCDLDTSAEEQGLYIILY